jgi:hypothetical protein
VERGEKRKREGSKLVPSLCRVYFGLREWHAIKLITFRRWKGGKQRRGGGEEEDEKGDSKQKRSLSHTYPHHEGVLLCSGTDCQLTSLSLSLFVESRPRALRSLGRPSWTASKNMDDRQHLLLHVRNGGPARARIPKSM